MSRITKELIKIPESMKKYLKKYPGKVILFTVSADIISRMEKITTWLGQIEDCERQQILFHDKEGYICH